MKLNHIESRTKIEGEKIYRMDRFEIGRYTVSRVAHLEGMKETYRSISVRSDAKYAPEIQYEDGFWTNETPKFTIQTCAYGALDVEDIKKVVEGYNEAIEVVATLTEWFCK